MSPLRWLVSCLLLLLTAATLAKAVGGRPSTRADVPLPAFGLVSHVLWEDQTDEERLGTLDRVAGSGASWIRLDFGWCALEEGGRGDIAESYLKRTDAMVDAARERRLKVLMTLTCTPRWANGGKARNVPPRDVDDYAAIARFSASHFSGRVAAWEVWNEPNQSEFWSTEDAETYTAMLKAAYPALKEGDPAALVLFGGTAYNDHHWIERAYRAGAKGSFDVMNTHPYIGRSDAPPDHEDPGEIYTLVNVTAVRDVMARYGDERLPIWFTEFGWSTHENTGREKPWKRGVSEAKQAEYLVRALRLVAERYPYVTHMFVYNDRDRDPEKTDAQNANFGIVRRDLTPKPAYRAVRDLVASERERSSRREAARTATRRTS